MGMFVLCAVNGLTGLMVFRVNKSLLYLFESFFFLSDRVLPAWATSISTLSLVGISIGFSSGMYRSIFYWI